MPRKPKGSENENAKAVVRKPKTPNKSKPVDVEEPVTSPKPIENPSIIKILISAQSNEAYHNKYIKELQSQYAKVKHTI